jgi:hypothetical protein
MGCQVNTPIVRLDVVVVDDVCRFACHVFQFLSRTIGFGIGQVPDDGCGDHPPFKRGEALETPAGDFAVWWVDAGALDWDDQLISVLSLVRGRTARFLVDVRSPLRSRGSRRYDVEKAVTILLGERRDQDIIPVSSYRSDNLQVNINGRIWEQLICAKSWKVLQRISAQRNASKPGLAGTHILITGAGFELEGRLGGCRSMGIPPTPDVLTEGWNRFFKKKPCVFEQGEGFPIPTELVDTSGGNWMALRAASRAWDLDAYWNEALKLVLETAGRAKDEPEPRSDKSFASQKEYRAREAFRQSFLRYDWGHLGQALDAASLPWTAWLSTNYTGFADRALAVEERESAGRAKDRRNPWRIISTSHEAAHLTRRLLHGPVFSEEGKEGRNQHANRFLFKLHGHIEHLPTMAMAGQDKEIYSTLSLPVDSLHEVYSAAGLYLEHSLEWQDCPVFWHVVGHGMKDRLLESLLLRVTERASARKHHFFFVRPDAWKAEYEYRIRFARRASWPVIAIPCRADQYLARLRSYGMADVHWEDVRWWSRLLLGD